MGEPTFALNQLPNLLVTYTKMFFFFRDQVPILCDPMASREEYI